MNSIDQRIISLVKLGQGIRQYLNGEFAGQAIGEELDRAVRMSFAHNGWFEESNVRLALSVWADTLSEHNLKSWVSKYPANTFQNKDQKKVGLILAGNLPLVGFHDVITVYIAGHHALVKLSSDDKILMPALLKAFGDETLTHHITWTERLVEYDAVIATGSNNTGRYFEHYFSKVPHIIRKSRNSIAVLSGDESDAELQALANDLFSYFGLGCRSVSMLYLPKEFDVQRLFQHVLDHKEVINNKKYGNNYDYYRAFYMLNKQDFLENGFFILKEDDQWAVPVSVINYQRYNSLEEVERIIREREDQLQCVVSNMPLQRTHFPLGQAQCPALWDYADNVDTLEFLSQLN